MGKEDEKTEEAKDSEAEPESGDEEAAEDSSEDSEADDGAEEESEEADDQPDEPDEASTESGAEDSDSDDSDAVDAAADADAGADADADEVPASSAPEESPWQAKMARAQELWDAGNNAELQQVVAELEKAPASEKEALELAADFRKRLRPDPIAIGLWLLTLGVFCLLTYLFVLR